MINVIQTLKNLNKAFPRFQLETLLKIVECVVDDYNYITWTSNDVHTYRNCPEKKWYEVTCEHPDSVTRVDNQNDSFVYTTTTKNHAADKTSYNQVITSAGEPASSLEDIFFKSTSNE